MYVMSLAGTLLFHYYSQKLGSMYVNVTVALLPRCPTPHTNKQQQQPPGTASEVTLNK